MNVRVMTTVGLLLGCSACGDSQVGAGNTLRFGLQVQYAETDGFAPIARGQALPLALQAKTKAALLNDYEFLDGTLTAADPTGANVPIEQTGTGKFKATFTRVGTHLLRATQGDVTDTLSVEVVEQAALRLARVRRSITTDTDAGTCSAGLADDVAVPQLKRNQSLNAALVPVDAADRPLLGVLKLEFAGPVTATKPLGVNANSFTFRPTGTGPQTLRVTDEVTAGVTDLVFDVATDDATCPSK